MEKIDLTKIKFKTPTENDLDFAGATASDVLNNELPVNDDEVLTLFGAVSKNEYLKQSTEITIYDRVLKLLSECTTTKYLVYNGCKVVGISTASETVVPEKSDYFKRNEYAAGAGYSRLIEYYTNTKVMLCVEKNDVREWVVAPPTLIGFSIVEYNERPIYR